MYGSSKDHHDYWRKQWLAHGCRRPNLFVRAWRWLMHWMPL